MIPPLVQSVHPLTPIRLISCTELKHLNTIYFDETCIKNKQLSGVQNLISDIDIESGEVLLPVLARVWNYFAH